MLKFLIKIKRPLDTFSSLNIEVCDTGNWNKRCSNYSIMRKINVHVCIVASININDVYNMPLTNVIALVKAY